MAKKKIYAVRKGHKTGLFDSWAECQKATAGYSGAEFRGFTDREEALAFLKMETEKSCRSGRSAGEYGDRLCRRKFREKYRQIRIRMCDPYSGRRRDTQIGQWK